MPQPEPVKRKRSRPLRTSLLAHGEPMLWLTGGALAVAVVMIVGLLALVIVQGAGTFWPRPVVEIRTHSGQTLMGEVTRSETFAPSPEMLAGLEGPAADAASQAVKGGDGLLLRHLMRVGNFELTGDHFRWVNQIDVAGESLPHWAITVERLAWGRFYGVPKSFKIDGHVVADQPEAAWKLFHQHHGPSRERWRQRRGLEIHETGEINSRIEHARLAIRQAELNAGRDSDPYRRAQARYAQVKTKGDADFESVRKRIDDLNAENDRFRLVFDTAQGQEVELLLADIVRAYPANQVSSSWMSQASIYAGRWWEFLAGEPREANSEGGVFPAIFGTVLMTIIMCLLVVPFGVLAALYLREYAKAGPIISAVRIAINNLAGVPSIVFGVFGLGFFVYVIGAYIDGGPGNSIGIIMPKPIWFGLLVALAGAIVTSAGSMYFGHVVRGRDDSFARKGMRIFGTLGLLLSAVIALVLIGTTPFFDGFFPAQVADRNPVFGKTALIWGSFTLALLTLPVVIVATEEALSAVPNSMREGSYACGASKWQTIKRIVLPRAMPGIMTGAILAMARGAGEVAPLMLVGAVKLAPERPFSFYPSEQFGVNRSFMHLGFHIYDLGFQSQNSEAAKPMVYTTTLLLIVLIAVLNLAAIWLRSRLRRKFDVSGF